MKKVIIFIMRTGIIGRGLQREFADSREYEALLTSDYQNAELYLASKVPHTVVVEAPDYSLYPLSACLDLCRRFKTQFPQVKCMLFLTYTHAARVLADVVEAKRSNEIDAFATANTPVEEIIATIESLG